MFELKKKWVSPYIKKKKKFARFAWRHVYHLFIRHWLLKLLFLYFIFSNFIYLLFLYCHYLFIFSIEKYLFLLCFWHKIAGKIQPSHRLYPQNHLLNKYTWISAINFTCVFFFSSDRHGKRSSFTENAWNHAQRLIFMCTYNTVLFFSFFLVKYVGIIISRFIVNFSPCALPFN